MADEEVIRRRLLIDGDGTGEDRKLNMLIRSLTKWCNSSSTPEESKVAHDRMLAQLAQCELAVTKSQLSSKMMAEELKKYETLSYVLLTGIETARQNIDKSKAALEEAKKVRKNRIEYDILAKVISEQPDRRETSERLAKLKSDLSSLESSKQHLEGRLALRRKQFHVMVNSLHQLQAMLDEPDDDGLNSSLEDVEMGEESQKSTLAAL